MSARDVYAATNDGQVPRPMSPDEAEAKAEGNLDDAKSHIELAIAKAPEQAMFHSNYGAILHSMGDLKGSVKELKKSLKIDKKLFQSIPI